MANRLTKQLAHPRLMEITKLNYICPKCLRKFESVSQWAFVYNDIIPIACKGCRMKMDTEFLHKSPNTYRG